MTADVLTFACLVEVVRDAFETQACVPRAVLPPRVQ